MTVMEIVLLLAGAAIFIISFFVPSKREGIGLAKADREELDKAVEDAVKDAGEKIRVLADETVKYATEKGEGIMDRLSNEKIMAINEYSETVIQSIDKNHQEVVFLYDMLNEKSVDLKNTVREAQQLQREAAKLQDEGAMDEALAALMQSPLRTAVRNSERARTKEAEAVMEQMRSATVSRALDKQKSSGPAAADPGGDAAGKADPAAAQTASAGAAQNDRDASGRGRKNKGKKKASAVEELAARAALRDREAMEAARPRERSASDVEVEPLNTPSSGRNKNEQILELHREGKSNVEIARELGLGMGEVKLVLSLYKV